MSIRYGDSKKVAIIIVNFNGNDDTFLCLESLRKIRYQDFQIILIDNASDNQSGFEKEINARFPEVKLFLEKENLGFSGGNNVGIKYALENNFDYILLLNNDTEVSKNFLDVLVDYGERNKNTGIISPKIFFHDAPNTIWYGGGKFSWFGGGQHMDYMKEDGRKEEEPKKIEYATGCAMLIKKEVFENIGLFEDAFFLYYEDTDFSLRARKSGYDILYVPKSYLWHKISRSSQKMGSPKIHYYHIRNALLLSKRNAPLWAKPFIYTWSILHYLKQILKLIILPSRKESSKMIMRGIEDFYKGKFGKLNESKK